ncbi:MAG: hypothetical protein A2W01_08050 [Candidatus Solincola sediminis]|nr:MAG: hypothetical protein A2W01_08050 [Candidatus Solincola sediminis]
MVQSLARCRSCGVPRELAENCIWTGAGGIALRSFRGNRVAMIGDRAIDIFWEKLVSSGVNEALLSREKNVMRHFSADSMAGIRGKVTRFGAVKKRALEAIEGLCAVLGLGKVEVERFSPGEMASILLVKPLNPWLLAAGIVGILEGLDNISYDYRLLEAGKGDQRLILEYSGEDNRNADDINDRPDLPEYIPGTVLDTCDCCGLPLDLEKFKWDELYGTIKTANGVHRMAFLPRPVLQIMANAPNDGSGESGLLEEAIYLSTVEQSGQRIPDEDIARILALRGWGRIDEAHRKDRSWRISIFQPVDTSMIAGWLRGLYTIEVGKEPHLSLVFRYEAAFYELD